MLIKDPSRFKIRNANSYDCVQLYRLLKECYLEVLARVNGQRDCLKQIDLNRGTLTGDRKSKHQNSYQNDQNVQTDANNNQLTRWPLDSSTEYGLDSFEEFVDCLGFGKRGEQRKVLDCLLIEDLREHKIIALVTYSYGYFSYVGREIHMNHFYVRPDYRMNGFGAFLFRNLVKLCAEAKLNKLKYDGRFKFSICEPLCGQIQFSDLKLICSFSL